jgi:hypothetical protein
MLGALVAMRCGPLGPAMLLDGKNDWVAVDGAMGRGGGVGGAGAGIAVVAVRCGPLGPAILPTEGAVTLAAERPNEPASV